MTRAINVVKPVTNEYVAHPFVGVFQALGFLVEPLRYERLNRVEPTGCRMVVNVILAFAAGSSFMGIAEAFTLDPSMASRMEASETYMGLVA